MATYSYKPAPENATATDNSIKDIVRVINNAMQGKINATLDITLSTGTSTVIADPRLAGESWLVPMPLSSTAASAIAGYYVTAQGKGTATINHAAGAAGRIVRLLIVA